MKKTILFLATILLGATLFTSCLKDGLNDFDAFNHPMYLHGEFNPNLGIPVGYASINVKDMLGMFQQSSSYININPSNDLLTIHYDTTIKQTISFDEPTQRAHKRGRIRVTKGGDTAAVHYEQLAGELDIDLFNSVTELNNVQIKNVMVNIDAFVKANAPHSTQTLIQDYGLEVVIDHINLTAIGKRGQTTLHPADSILVVSDLLNGETINLFHNTDIANLINIQPKKITYQARMAIVIPNKVFTSSDSLFIFMNDSLHINDINIDAALSLDFPLSVAIDTLSYSDTLALHMNLDMNELTIDTSSIIMEFENSLPLNLVLGAYLEDSITHRRFDLFDNTQVTLQSASLTSSSRLGTYVSAQPTTSVIRIPLDREKFQAFCRSKQMIINAQISTSPVNGVREMVSVKGSDALEVKVYAQIHPNLSLNIPILGAKSTTKHHK